MENYSDKKLNKIKETIETLHEKFTRDEGYKALPKMQQEESSFIISLFAELMYTYHLQEISEWRVFALEDICGDIMPRKVSSGIEFYRSVEPVLSSFFRYLQKNGIINNAVTLTNELKKIAPLMIKKSQNPKNWGPAKALYMNGLKSGMLDETNLETLDETLQQYIEKVNQKSEKVGRNDL